MDKLLEIFSTRELALIIWFLTIFMSVLIFSKSIRQGIGKLVKYFFKWKLNVINFSALSYCGVIVWLLWKVGLWDNSLVKDTIFWFLGSGMFFLIKLTKAKKEEDYFKNILMDNIKVILILEFVMNFHQFSLLTELIMLPIITILALVKDQAVNEEKSKILVKPLNGLFIILGLIFILIAIKNIINDISEFANFSTLKSFLLPIILSITFIPCIYLTAIFMQYENLFLRLGFFLKNPKDLSFAKRRLVWKAGLKRKKLIELSNKINSLYRDSTREEIKKTIS